MSNVLIRNYRSQDLPEVVKLYKSSMVKAPFFFRDSNSFVYFTSYPGVKEDSIFIATSEDQIQGIAIVAIIKERYTLGKIIELWASEPAAGDSLLQKAVEYCRDNNIDAVEVSPPTFLDLDNTFAGWQRIDQRGVLMAKPLSLFPLLQALFSTEVPREINAENRFLFACDGETIEVKITESEVDIVERDEPGADSDNSILIRVSSKTLLETILGLTNPYIALISGRIKIRGITDIFRGMTMLRAIRLNKPWTVAIADDR